MMVSVIIPVYNCEEHVWRAIDSALSQTYREVEVIVIDDGSTDGTPGVLSKYGTRIRRIRQENSGVSAARNTGVEVASGEYISFLDSDDLWFEDKLAVQVRLLERYPDLDAVFSNFQTIDGDGRLLEENGIKKLYSVLREKRLELSAVFTSRTSAGIPPSTAGGMNGDFYYGNIFSSLFSGNFINTSSITVRKSAIDRAGRFNAGLRTQEDYDCWLRLCRTNSVGYLDTPLLQTRKRPGQLTGCVNLEDISKKSLEIVEGLAAEHGHLLDARAVKRRLSQKHGELALIRLCNGKTGEAREGLRKSLGYDPFSLRHILYYAWSFMPVQLSRALLNRSGPAGKDASGP